MAARGAMGNSDLASLVRERQDLVREWQNRDADHGGAVSLHPAKRDKQVEARNIARMTAIEKRIAEIDEQLVAGFPEYSTLVNPAPANIDEVKRHLKTSEALVLFLDTPKWTPTSEETFIWIVTKTASRWVRSSLGTTKLIRFVATLRCGLDKDAWKGTGRRRCRDAIGVSPKLAVLPFHLGKAHVLYNALFGKIEDLVKDKHLLVVPSGALTRLPFQVLVTKKPAKDVSWTQDDYRKVAWLGRRNAITVLPTVASLVTLRQHSKAGLAPRAYLGIGNPLLVGKSGANKSAWKYQRCSNGIEIKPIQLKSTELLSSDANYEGKVAVPSEVRKLAPLPDTGQELCRIAKRQGGGQDDALVLLGERATERQIKLFSMNGVLANYRVVHFATHGLLAGGKTRVEYRLSEPALVLTPPADGADRKSLREDDGLLTASEVTTLKLKADWVILSACNTAAGDKVGTEALSGLARAFFYAGTRALLVSHWKVLSDAAVRLTTGVFDAMDQARTDGKPIGRAEALRRSMTRLLTSAATPITKQPWHPATWAPFIIVGEGGERGH